MEAFVTPFTSAAKSLGIDLDPTTTGGSSDGNLTASQGVPTIDGLGPVGGGYHTADEFVAVDTIFERAAIAAGALENLVSGSVEGP
jgi:glutamate carboxypeptidase